MRFIRRKIQIHGMMVILIGILFSLSLLAGQCGRSSEGPPADSEGEDGPPPAPAVQAEPTEDRRTEIFYGSSLGTEANRNPERQIINQFEVAHPEINISRFPLDISPDTIMSYLDQVPFSVVMTVQAGHHTASAMQAGRLLDIGQLWSDTNLYQAYPDTFRRLGEHDGKQYFLPAFYSWFALYYNKEIFETYNLQPPETWTDFLAVSERLLENGVTPLVYSGDNTQLTTVWFDYLNMRLNGPDFHAALMQGEARFDDPRVGDVFETWAFLVESGYIAPEAWGLGLSQSRDMVLDGKASMILLGAGQAPEELDFFRFPLMDPTLPTGEIVLTIGYVIPADVSYPVEALAFLTYLSSAESQTTLLQQFGSASGSLPVHQGVALNVFTPGMIQGLTLVQQADDLRPPYYQSFEVSMAMTTPVVKAFRDIVRGEDYEANLLRLERERLNLFGQ